MWVRCFILFSSFILSLPAWAYQFTTDFKNGFYWASIPVSIIVEESNPDRKKILESLSKAAISDWESETGLKLWDFAGGTRNLIRWSSRFAEETRMDPNSVLAVAVRYTDGPYFAKTEIIINGSHPLNSYENYLRTTITHELGHTMGLDHSEVAQAVMAPSLQPIYYGLHSDDVDGMQAVVADMEYKQRTGYVSRYAFVKEEVAKQPLSCGTTAPATAGVSHSGMISLLSGILITLVRRIKRWFKSLK